MLNFDVVISSFIGTLMAMLALLVPIYYLAKKKLANSMLGGFA